MTIAALAMTAMMLTVSGDAFAQKTVPATPAKTEVATKGAQAASQATKTETNAATADTAAQNAVTDTAAQEMLDEAELEMSDTTAMDEAVPEGGVYSQLKTKFVEGGAGFMSLIALCLIIGLACCIERIVYLSMSEIDAKKFMADLEKTLKEKGAEAAKELCRNTRGPVASICYQGVLRKDDDEEAIERSVSAYGSVQIGNMEKGCSWIKLFIAMAPSLGFLGTVIGMVMAFDQIQVAGDISPTIVAGGMKVALITTIFGIVVAVVLQLFYNYIISKIEHLTAQMEESAITLMDILKSN